MMMYVWFILAGVFAGVCAGLFGVGGGMIVVPALMWIFAAYGLGVDVVAHLAVGTSLATIVVTSISSLMAHQKRGGVRWDVWRHMSVGLVLGSLVGACVAGLLDGQMLQGLIGGAALLIAVKMLFFPNREQSGCDLPSVGVQFGAGTGIGLASSIFGIGGGSLTVPFLSYAGLPMAQAVGTSAACGLPIALAGAIGFAWFGQAISGLPAGTIGFVHIPAFVCVSVSSFAMAKVGARLAHKLPAQTLKRAFGCLLILVGGQLLLSGLGVL